MAKLSKRARQYLGCVINWSVDWEVAERLADGTEPRAVRAMLGRLIVRGLVEWSGNVDDVYRITSAGRAALATDGEG